MIDQLGDFSLIVGFSTLVAPINVNEKSASSSWPCGYVSSTRPHVSVSEKQLFFYGGF